MIVRQLKEEPEREHIPINDVIEELKDNLLPFRCLSKQHTSVLLDAKLTNSLYYLNQVTGRFIRVPKQVVFRKGRIYRVAVEYKPRELGWVEHAIKLFPYRDGQAYGITSDIGGVLFLHEMATIPGFGGVQFKIPKEGGLIWSTQLVYRCPATGEPARPVKVRFWGEIK